MPIALDWGLQNWYCELDQFVAWYSAASTILCAPCIERSFQYLFSLLVMALLKIRWCKIVLGGTRWFHLVGYTRSNLSIIPISYWYSWYGAVQKSMIDFAKPWLSLYINEATTIYVKGWINILLINKWLFTLWNTYVRQALHI